MNKYTLTITAQELQIIAMSLSYQPYRQVVDLIKKIEIQVDSQVKSEQGKKDDSQDLKEGR